MIWNFTINSKSTPKIEYKLNIIPELKNEKNIKKFINNLTNEGKNELLKLKEDILSLKYEDIFSNTKEKYRKNDLYKNFKNYFNLSEFSSDQDTSNKAKSSLKEVTETFNKLIDSLNHESKKNNNIKNLIFHIVIFQIFVVSTLIPFLPNKKIFFSLFISLLSIWTFSNIFSNLSFFQPDNTNQIRYSNNFYEEYTDRTETFFNNPSKENFNRLQYTFEHLKNTVKGPEQQEETNDFLLAVKKHLEFIKTQIPNNNQ
ncbi:hypothetical protein [Mycoplasma sp. 480]|uniref:hypothetical protein n=1 Tax=Mycoplasma sp. 480 TaxID=3440155 RepID=UPI003F51ABCD